MIIIELFVKTYQLVKDNLILVQPLLLFLMLIAMVLAPVSMGGFNPAVLIVVVGLYCAFCAGWYSMFHKSIKLAGKELSAEEKATNTISVLKEFFPGVGKYFPRILVGFVVYVVLLIIVVNVIGDFVGAKYIGFPQSITSAELLQLFMNGEKSTEILNKISEADKMRIGLWNGLTFILISFFTYLTMFWSQAIVAEDKNPLIAHFESLKTVLKRPLTSLIIFTSYWGSIVGISILGTRESLGFFVHLLVLMILTLTIVYFTMMTFLYFEKYRKNNSISWTNSFR
ncbi:MAG: hypothetical protein ACD_20C00172G0002 [uncultured bacterium]|nr:MAG: hypothetical protein ACD_20C00172G0002 [uncultured bacterium]HBH18735.1 hypothetical protein [Cyanobacteria bacterium UBA9579]